MLVNGKRELAYIQIVHDIEPITGADSIEKIHVLGWDLIAKKGEFKEGDKCVYNVNLSYNDYVSAYLSDAENAGYYNNLMGKVKNN